MKEIFLILLLFSTTCSSSVRYTFTPEACKEGYYLNVDADSTTNSTVDGRLIILNNRTIHCAPCLGVSSTSIFGAAIGSEGSIGVIVSPVSDGIAFELWLKPSDVELSEQPILTIGQRNLVFERQIDANAVDPCDTGGYDFQLAVVNNAWTATFRSSSAPFDQCRILSVGSVTPGRLAHVVVSLADQHQAIYLNGQVGSSVAQDSFNLSHWNMNDHGLHLLGYQTPFAMETTVTPTASTTLYQLAVYEEPITQTHVRELLLRGLPSTPPFAYDQNVTVNEDAEIVPGSHSIAWYRTSATPTDAALLAGPMVGSLDREVQILIAESMINTSNSTALTELAPVYVYITGRPTQGLLYFADGTSLDDEAVLVPVGTAPVHSLIYVPPYNAHSIAEDVALASFRYCISTTAIFDTSQCASSATVYIRVTPVNDPPVALAVPVTNVMEGIDLIETAAKIPLLGSDVDDGDSIQQVQITKPPAYGDLILAVSSFRKDFIRHGTPLSNLSYTVSGDDPVYVKYSWRPDARGSRVIQGMAIKDSFTFRVRDELGHWSAEEMVEIQIVSAVAAVADQVVAIDEDSRGILKWSGKDNSGYNRRIGFFVEKVPAPEVGVLLDQATNKPLKVGASVAAFNSYPYENGVQVAFQPTKNFCHGSEAELEYDAEIRFRVAAYADDVVVSVSDSISQMITVACVLDVMSMTVPVGFISALESSLERATSDPCYGASFDGAAPGQSCEAAAIINGIMVTSIDRKANWVFVSVSTESGFLTFNKLYWNRTEPVVGRRVLASGSVSFYAYPEDLTNIFSVLHFQSFSPGADSIDFEIQYGSCSKFEVEQTPGSFNTSTCQVIRKSIAVEVLRDNNKYKSETRIVVGFPWQIIFCLLVYPALYIAVVYLEIAYTGDDDEETVIEGSPLEPVERFIQHEDENGMFYYEDTLEGTVRWDLPAGDDFVRAGDIGSPTTSDE
jgi:Bacterial Ig domain